MSDDDIQQIALERARAFPRRGADDGGAAAKIILDGVKADRWRILVGDDAHLLDERVRKTRRKPTRRSFTRASPRRSAGGSGNGKPAMMSRTTSA